MSFDETRDWHDDSGTNPFAVDKAVNYILGQPDGKYLETVSISCSC